MAAPSTLNHFGPGSENKIALIGHPNVGKSVIFHKLTGQFVTVSNYPGTTLEIARGISREMPDTVFLDTPGVVTFPPQTEDEQVTAKLLLNIPLRGILQVGDAKNLRRTLLLTIQLAEMGVPLVLALNMMDEAMKRGLEVDHARLASILHIPVIPTTAIRGLGVQEILEKLQDPITPDFHIEYPADIEDALKVICTSIARSGNDREQLSKLSISPRAIALLWLENDPVTDEWLCNNLEEDIYNNLIVIRERLQSNQDDRLDGIIQNVRLEYIKGIVDTAMIRYSPRAIRLSDKISRSTLHPLWGTFILAGVLVCLYWFVGVFGAGTLVDFFEGVLFGEYINPWVINLITESPLPPLITELLVGEFGLWTMGMTYALALIFPIVTTFFFAFGILEDSGYLPRLSALSNRFFQSMGLNGKAVLPIVLGLGCVTMAALTTRVLSNRRDRILVTLLLALAIPCSAQLGIIMGMLAGISIGAAMIWGGVILLVLFIVGWLAARLLPGDRSPLLVELPPMRFPALSNVVAKTVARLEWYLKEVIPLFLLGTFVMFLLSQTGILDSLILAFEPLVTGWLGLPQEASAAFLMGFLRRDFGATGLFVMQSQGNLTPIQVVVAMVTITLFVPCVASVMVIAKERGWRTALSVILIVFPLAFLVGGLLYRALAFLNWGS